MLEIWTLEETTRLKEDFILFTLTCTLKDFTGLLVTLVLLKMPCTLKLLTKSCFLGKDFKKVVLILKGVLLDLEEVALLLTTSVSLLLQLTSDLDLALHTARLDLLPKEKLWNSSPLPCLPDADTHGTRSETEALSDTLPPTTLKPALQDSRAPTTKLWKTHSTTLIMKKLKTLLEELALLLPWFWLVLE